MRKRHAITIAAVIALLGQQGVAVAQSDVSSANYFMNGCRSFATKADARGAFLHGSCVGRVATIFQFGRRYFGVCPPDGANVGQAVRVVILYIDQRPERLHELFLELALEALQQAWPCRR
jgi:hypothetical protein